MLALSALAFAAWWLARRKMPSARMLELVESASLGQRRQLLVARFGDALARYRARDWEGAERGFAHCLALAPDDAPSQVLQARVQSLRAEPPSQDWDGVYRLTSK